MILLLSAYAPAVVIYACLQPTIERLIVLLAIAAVLAATLWLILHRTYRRAVFDGAIASQVRLKHARTRESELAAFLLGYLLPFVQWSEQRGPLAFLALPLLVALVLYLNWHIGVLHLNPTLMALGWRVVEMDEENAEGDDARVATVLCKSALPGPNETLGNENWSVARISFTSRAALWLARPRDP